MRKIVVALATMLACILASSAASQFQQQQGFGGGGGFGGGMGGGFGGRGNAAQQGKMRAQYDNSVQEIDREIGMYLNGEEIKNVLTPGEYSEWPLTLKAGQVVIAEARSDAFDPALEIVDDKKSVLATNDDRYPGDQRPLLLWHCEKDGVYPLRVRCFHDKSGGQLFLRFNIYDTLDLGSGQNAERQIDSGAPFLLRVSMKAGQIKQLIPQFEPDTIGYAVGQRIAPNGLPFVDLAPQISSNYGVIVAPVDGDYYVLCAPYGERGTNGKARAVARGIVPQKLARSTGPVTGTAVPEGPAIWELPVKAGDFLEASTNVELGGALTVVGIRPDFSKFDLAKPETDPFAPSSTSNRVDDAVIFDTYPARARDNRVTAFDVRKDAVLWIATTGATVNEKPYTFEVKPAATQFEEDRSNSGKLRVGCSDYWAFDAKAGDVMTFRTSSSGFAEQIYVRDPNHAELQSFVLDPDESGTDWNLVVQRPGRYLVAVSCLGDGGAGAYSLTRSVIHASVFSRIKPAQGVIARGQLQILKFTVTPKQPVLMHWQSNDWNYSIAVYDDKGSPAAFNDVQVDGHNRYGVISVPKEQTYVIVLQGTGDKSDYLIELKGLPGLTAGT